MNMEISISTKLDAHRVEAYVDMRIMISMYIRLSQLSHFSGIIRNLLPDLKHWP